MERKPAVISEIDEKPAIYQPKEKQNSKNTLELRDKIITEELLLLHNKFVFVPIDKASSYVHFVCQRQFAQVLISEVGLNNVNTIRSRHMKTIKLEKIVSDNTSFLTNKLNLEISKTNKKFPFIYWTPKSH